MSICSNCVQIVQAEKVASGRSFFFLGKFCSNTTERVSGVFLTIFSQQNHYPLQVVRSSSRGIWIPSWGAVGDSLAG